MDLFDALGVRDCADRDVADASDFHTCWPGRVGYGKDPGTVQRMGGSGLSGGQTAFFHSLAR